MHDFSELVQHTTTFTLNALDSAQRDMMNELQSNAATPLIKALQMVQLQRTISAVGMFSMFDAILQEDLQCADGFRKVEELLTTGGELALKGKEKGSGTFNLIKSVMFPALPRTRFCADGRPRARLESRHAPAVSSPLPALSGFRPQF